MNRAYRKIWCSSRNMLVVVAENASARRKGNRNGKAGKKAVLLTMSAAAFLAGATLPGQAWALNAICFDPDWNEVGTANGANSVACGEGAIAHGAAAIAIGQNSVAGNSGNANIANDIAIGNGAKATGGNSIAQGNGALATNSASTAIGNAAKSYGKNSVAIGANSEARNDYTIALGDEALAGNQVGAPSGTGINAIAIGRKAKATWSNAVALGNEAQALFSHNIAIGNEAFTNGSATGNGNNISIGNAAGKDQGVLANGNIALGMQAGQNVNGRANQAWGFGAGKNVSGNFNISMGNSANFGGSTATPYNQNAAMALGYNATSSGPTGYTIALGGNSTASGEQAIAIGGGLAGSTAQAAATASGKFSVALGAGAQASGPYAAETLNGNQRIASSSSVSSGDVAIGSGTRALGGNSIAQGINAISTSTANIAIGNGAIAGNETLLATVNTQLVTQLATLTNLKTAYNTAYANYMTANPGKTSADALKDPAVKAALDAVKLQQADIDAASATLQASAPNAIAIGNGAKATGTSSISIGTGNVVSGANSGAIGDPSIINGANSYSVGNNNTIGSTTQNAFALGNNVYLGANAAGVDTTSVSGAVALGNATSVTKAGGVALGENSVASVDTGVQGYDPLGRTLSPAGATWRSTRSAVSIGSDTTLGGPFEQTRQITGLAAGTTDTDAVNVAQLKAAQTHYYSVNDGGTIKVNYTNNGATGLNALAAGVEAQAAGQNSVSVGYQNIISQTAPLNSNDSTALGQRNTLSNAENSILIGANNTITTSTSVSGIGGGNVAAGSAASSITGIGNRLTGSSATSIVGIGNTVSSTATPLTATELATLQALILTIQANPSHALTATEQALLDKLSSNNVSGTLNTLTNSSQNSVLGNQNTLVNGEQNFIAGFKNDLGANLKGNQILGSNVTVADDIQNGVAIGMNTNLSQSDGVALGSSSVADRPASSGSTAATWGGYNPRTGQVDGADAAIDATRSKLAAVSVGAAGSTRQIANVAAGTIDSDAVNVAQLKAVSAVAQNANQGWNIGNDAAGTAAAVGNVAPGERVDFVSGDAGNTEVTVIDNTTTGQSVVTVKTAKSPLQYTDTSTAAGGDIPNANQFIATDQVTLVGAGGQTDQGVTINNVSPAELSATSLQAVNGSQLYTVGNSVVTALGGTSTFNTSTGQVVAGLSVGGNSYTSVQNALNAINTVAGAHNTVSAGTNIAVTTSPNTAGGTNYTVSTKPDAVFDSVTITNGPTINSSGINMNGDTITGLADGVNNSDAVNLGQLKAVSYDVTKVTNLVGTNPTNSDGSTGLTTYDVAGQNRTDNPNILTAINKMNREGIKFFHTNNNDESPLIGATNDASAGAPGSTAVGVNAIVNATATNGVALGRQSGVGAGAENAVAIGNQAKANGASAIAMGNGSQALGAQSIAIGTGNKVYAARSGAIGDPTTIIASATDSYSIGNNNNVNTAHSFVMGNNVTTTVGDSVYLGRGAAASAARTSTTAGMTTYNSEIINGITYDYAGGTPVGVVTVGAAGGERRIQNVAAGLVSATSTDAINGSQLYQVAETANAGWNMTVNGKNPSNVGPGQTVDFRNTDGNIRIGKAGNNLTFNLNPNLRLNSVTTGDTHINTNGLFIKGGPSVTKTGIDAAGQKVTNVADGTAPYDAINRGQLDALDNQLSREIDKVDDRASAGIASAMAAASVPQATMPGANLLGAGTGYYNGHSALSVGYSALTDNGKWIIRSNFSINSEDAAVSAGVGYQW